MRVKRMILKLMKILSESVLPVFFWTLLIFAFDAPYIAILTMISAAAHEAGHIISILFLGGRLEIPRGHVSGFRIRRSSTLAYGREIIILLAGPLTNVLVFSIAIMLIPIFDGYAVAFAIINAATAISNMLPIEGYDGYGILFQIFSSRGLSRALLILEYCSFLITVCFTFFSLYLLDKFGSGYWIFAMFFCMMIAKLTKFGKFNVFKE